MLLAVLSRRRSLYSTRRLVDGAERRGHEVIVLDPLQCSLVLGRDTPEIHYRNLGGRLAGVEAVLPRIGASITEHGLAVVNQFDMMGAPIINNAQAIARSRDKLRSLQLLARAGIDIPRTVMARHPSQVAGALEIVGGPPAILKLVRGTQGIGVILAETEQAAQQVMETLWSVGMTVLVQEFIEESEGTDIRVIVIGSKAVTAMRRQARVGEFRSNVHRGATGTPVDLPAEYALAAVRATRAMHLQVAGVDLLESRGGPKVLEVNSSPGFEGIERCTGADVAGAVIDYAVGFARRTMRRRRAAPVT
jgi:ribosomal protein S6--L-glutamate ligase